MKTLNITVENNAVIARRNGEGEGAVICGFESEQQVQDIIERHNYCEKVNPSIHSLKAIRV